MARPSLEVADIFRDHGAAWREANRGSVSLDQMKVMSAIERCRTAELGGHVARCQNDTCGHTVIAYNSCRNRHCPKCQAAASREWMVAREAELLPVAYFHVVFTLPAEVADIAYQNKRVVYDLLFKASAEAMQTIAADPRHLGAKIAITTRAAHLGHGHDPPSARAHDRTGRGIVEGWRTLDSLPQGLLPARASTLEAVPAAHAREAHRRPCERPAQLLWRPCPPCRGPGVQALLSTVPPAQVVRLCQAPVRRAEGGARLPVTLYAPRRDLEPPPPQGRRHQCELQHQGLPRQPRQALDAP